ncbi:MAG: hypothetical protein D6E12_15990 [Desulfovibrio sp.]|nr:MAG: hypothetical protein D6E12_15990 [Desulfovibrio sp.]
MMRPFSQTAPPLCKVAARSLGLGIISVGAVLIGLQVYFGTGNPHGLGWLIITFIAPLLGIPAVITGQIGIVLTLGSDARRGLDRAVLGLLFGLIALLAVPALFVYNTMRTDVYYEQSTNEKHLRDVPLAALAMSGSHGDRDVAWCFAKADAHDSGVSPISFSRDSWSPFPQKPVDLLITKPRQLPPCT